MKRNFFKSVFLAMGALALIHPTAAQQPNTLRHTIGTPVEGPQIGAMFGDGVAVDGGLTVVGVPYDGSGGLESGVVKVFDSATGALLHVIPNPSPAVEDYFGTSVAISGTRVVVSAADDDTAGTDAGSVYVFDLSGASPTVPVATLNNPTPVVENYFGTSVAISGTRVVVGAMYDDTGATNAGSAYVYDLSSGSPTVPVATLNNPSPAVDDRFGYSVTISGTRVVVAALLDDAAAGDSGIAYVYDLSSGAPQPTPVATLNNPSPAASDQFGNSVSISGTRVVVGARNDDTGATNAGIAYVYDLSSGTPQPAPVATLNNPDPAADDQFGFSVSISGTRVVVAAVSDDTGASGAGIAYVYDLTSGTPQPTPVATLNNPGPAVQDYFGNSVAISGTRVVVGAHNDDTGGNYAGNAYVYDLSSGSPTEPVATLNRIPANDWFGNSVAISGTLVVVGAPDEANAVGRAYVYDLASATPLLPVATLNNPTPAKLDFFGNSVAISGMRVVVGANGDQTGATNAGSAYVYDLASATPTVPVATLNNPSPGVGDYFGFSVAISGMRVVVGASLDDPGANNAGSAYVYNLASGPPTAPEVTLNKPARAVGDQFGSSVAISGTRVVVGAPYDDTGANAAGSVYVYDLTSGTPSAPVTTLNNPAPAVDDQFGNAVAISGARVVVGALLDDTGADAAGSAYVYDLTSGTPSASVTTLNNPAPAADDQFGNSVAISGTRVLVGVRFDDTGASEAGSAYAYDLASGMPTIPVATLNNPSPAVNDRFGNSVAIAGSIAAIGTPLDDLPGVDRGSVYIFGPAETTPPAGGSFTISPASPVSPTTTLTGDFDLWTDASLPLTYEIREGDTVIVAADSNPSPTFTLPGGEHTITGRVYDSAGSYTVVGPVTIVVDDRAPSITTPGDITVDATGPTGAVVNFSVLVEDEVDANPTFTVTPPSGSIFPIGTTTVTVTAKDAFNNERTRTFRVRVVPEFPFATEISTTGDAVPGAGSDSRIQAGALWTTLATPAINDAGQIAYLGKWKAPAVTGPVSVPAQSGVGIFIDHTLLVKVGDAVLEGGPGNIPANAIFKTLRDPVMDRAGHVTFLATIAGPGISSNNDMVVMSNGEDGVLKALAREGSEAPGTGGAVFKSFTNVSALGTTVGGALFTASLKAGSGSPKVTSANDTGAWMLPEEASALVKMVREGDPGFAVGETIKSFTVLKAQSGSPGHGRGHTSETGLIIPVTLAGGPIPRQALVWARTNGLTELAATGDGLGGATLPNATWKTMYMPSVGNEWTFIAVLGTLTPEVGEVTRANAKGIFVSTDNGATWEPLARLGVETPGFGAGVAYSALFDPVNSSTDSSVAFQGTIKGGTVRGGDNDAIWWKPDGGQLTLVAREGAQPPGASADAKWKSFTSLALPGGGAGPIFTAKLKPGAKNGGITAKNDMALYAMDSFGTLHEVMRENQPLANLTDKTVKTFNVLKAVSGTAGVTRAFNATHQIAAQVTYTDGTSGIVKIEVP